MSNTVDTFNFFNDFVSKKGFFNGDKLEKQFDLVIQRKLCSEYFNTDFNDFTNEDMETNTTCKQFQHATFIQVFGGGNDDVITTKSFWKSKFQKIYNSYNNNNNNNKNKQQQQHQSPPKYDLKRRNSIDLRLTAFDITNGMLKWFDKINTPNMPISKAIRISSGIPWIFEPVLYQGNLYVDGGVLRRMPIDAFQVNEHKHMLVLKISSDFQPIKPEQLKHMSMMEYTGKLLRTITMQSQDLDLIQRAKDKMKGQMHFIDFTMMKHMRKQSGIEFDISFYKKARMVETGYKIMWNHILECDSNNSEHNITTTSFKALKKIITMDLIHNYIMNNNNNMILKHNGGDDNKKLISSLSCASNKNWIDNMYKKANENDIINGNIKDSTNSKNNNNDIEHDYKMERNLAILICITLVLSICLGKLRNLSHIILLNQFSNIETTCCKHCQRNWVPSELSYVRVNKLTKEEIIEALKVRGFVDDDGIHDKDDDEEYNMKLLRQKLKHCVYVENISFKRPWSFLYHSSVCPCRWSKDFPINEWVVLFVAMWYLMSITWTVNNILGKKEVGNDEL